MRCIVAFRHNAAHSVFIINSFSPRNNTFQFPQQIQFYCNNRIFIQSIRFRPAKTHLKSERVARRENIRASVCAARMLSLRQNKRSCRVGGHAPPQRHLERSAATTKTRFTGRKQNKRERILLSSRHSTKEGFTGRKRVKRKRLPVVFPS